MVGPGKKYATVPEALKALAPSQAHIARLEEENRRFREAEAEKARKAEEEAAAARQAEQTAAQVAELRKLMEQERSGASAASPAFNVEDLRKTVAEVVQENQKNAEREANEKAFKAEMDRKFGAKAEEEFRRAAEANGLTTAELSELVRTKPTLAKKALGLEAKAASASSPFLSTVNLSVQSTVQAAPKPVMGGATSEQIAAAWNYAGTLVKPT